MRASLLRVGDERPTPPYLCGWCAVPCFSGYSKRPTRAPCGIRTSKQPLVCHDAWLLRALVTFLRYPNARCCGLRRASMLAAPEAYRRLPWTPCPRFALGYIPPIGHGTLRWCVGSCSSRLDRISSREAIPPYPMDPRSSSRWNHRYDDRRAI